MNNIKYLICKKQATCGLQAAVLGQIHCTLLCGFLHIIRFPLSKPV